MILNRNDYFLADGGGFGVGYDILNDSEFSASEVGLALWLLSERRIAFGEGVFAIDCGANIGVHTIEWARHMYGWGSLLAVEAQEKVFYALAGNIAINNCFNARAVWAAVGEAAGSINVPSPDYFRPSSFGSLEIQESLNNEFIGQPLNFSNLETIETSMFAIDDLELERIDFIKIDIEGMEVQALRGAVASIRRCLPYLLIEKIKSDQVALVALLEDLQYSIFDVGMNFLAVPKSDSIVERIPLYFSTLT
jgi:FkbM family methyltransferase